ncbi:hypothetical protein D0T50_05000 [Bacteroides sp. 214]|uniref:hypothetical protein n=1 Tax=Bacteroides sp. 214 TaxID=2302935 RepID=UPI0013D375F6|nr:hypothetical protein [Bacteroides sp. 214]NDW12246.1 hypothetical protein [Bacteroides sp. 214]
MKTYKRLLFLSFLPLLFISCSQRKVTNPLLLRADSLMECCPDSALSLLTAFSASVQHENHPTRMYYNLLLTKAQDKCFLTHTSDLLMNPVVDYYQKHGNMHKKKSYQHDVSLKDSSTIV